MYSKAIVLLMLFIYIEVLISSMLSISLVGVDHYRHVVLPLCAVNKIRDVLPSDEYTGHQHPTATYSIFEHKANYVFLV